MTLTRKITATIPRTGLSTGSTKPRIEADGFVGNSCADATRLFTAALGITADETVKAEYYETVPDIHVQTHGS